MTIINNTSRFFSSTSSHLKIDVLKKNIAAGNGSYYISCLWDPSVANLFIDLDNKKLARTLSGRYTHLGGADQYAKGWSPVAQESIFLYPLLDKIKSFTFEEQSILFDTTGFCEHGGVWFTGRISTLLDPTNPFNQSEIGIIGMLHILECKEKDFESRHEHKAKNSVNQLRTALREAFDEYWQKASALVLDKKVSEEEINSLLTHFREQWETAINDAKPELIQYRGMGNILLNILANVVSLGALIVYTGYQSGGKNLLSPLLRSDTENILKTLEICSKGFSAQVFSAGPDLNSALAYPVIISSSNVSPKNTVKGNAL